MMRRPFCFRPNVMLATSAAELRFLQPLTDGCMIQRHRAVDEEC